MNLGKLINSRYKIADKIGIGGMSTVYLARDTKTGEAVAVKVMDDKLTNDPDYVSRFEREAHIGISLNHPNIANVITYGKEEDSYYLVMEYIQGITLTEYIRNRGPLPVKEAVNITQQVLSALSYAYSKGIQAHRDIKPGNIMIDLKTNTVKVMDFGIAKTVGSSLTHSTALYTPRYASPEQLLPTRFGNRTDQRTDTYAIGIVLYEMLVGKSPYSGTTPAEISEQQLKGHIPNLSQLRKDIPESFSQIILRCLQTNPDQRYQKIDELTNDLKRGICSKPLTPLQTDRTVTGKRYPQSSQSIPQPYSPPQSKQFNPLFAIIPAVVIIIAIIIGFSLKGRNTLSNNTNNNNNQTTATLSVTSTPIGADIYIDGAKIGITPLDNYSLKTGQHTLLLKKEGYEDNQNTIEIKENEKLSIGAHTLKITKEGYNDYTQTFTLTSSDISKTIPVVLTSIPPATSKTGTLSISSTPSVATVYINNQNKGTTPLTLTLNEGTYSVRLTMDGYEEYTENNTIQSAKTSTVQAQLKKKSTTGKLVWKYKTGSWVDSSPTVSNGKLYIGSYDHYIYCLDASNGSLVWKYETGSSVWSSPTIYNGKLYIGSYDGYIYCLDASNGSLVWKYETENAVNYSSPTIYNGKLYVGSWDDYIYCLDASNGSLVWKYKTGDSVESSPTIYNGKLYVGSNDSYIYCLDAENGNFIWKYQTEKYVFNYYEFKGVYASPFIIDRKLYVGSDDSYIYCLDTENGNLIWKYKTGFLVQSSPFVYNGKLYVGSMDNYLYCIEANNGTLVWKYKVSLDILSSPTAYNNRVYFGASNSSFYCLDALKGSLIWSYPIAHAIVSSPIIYNGKVYFGSQDTYIYCIDIGEQ